MSHLLDTNFLIAAGWASHQDHVRASKWLKSAKSYSTCPVVQMGFMRVSLSHAFGASFEDALAALNDIVSSPQHRFVSDSIEASQLPPVHGTKEVTDAHLVKVAARHRLNLITLDKPLCGKSWAKGIAEFPA